MKTTISISIDGEVLEKVKDQKINISGTINEYFKSLIAIKEQDIEGIDIEIAHKNIEKLDKNIAKLTSERQKHVENITKWEEIKQKKEQKMLESEKKEIERIKKCCICGFDITSFDETRVQKLKDGTICCKNCFYSNYKRFQKEGKTD